jgi:hypothetical protein
MWHVTFPLQVKLAYDLFYPSSYSTITAHSFTFLVQYFISINVTTKEYRDITAMLGVYVKEN